MLRIQIERHGKKVSSQSLSSFNYVSLLSAPLYRSIIVRLFGWISTGQSCFGLQKSSNDSSCSDSSSNKQQQPTTTTSGETNYLNNELYTRLAENHLNNNHLSSLLIQIHRDTVIYYNAKPSIPVISYDDNY